MKCIEAVEGSVKCILKQLHSTHNLESLDDSNYIHQVKTVIGAIDQYVRKNPEIIDDPSNLKQGLYVYSRNLWLTGLKSDDMTPPSSKKKVMENDDYETYYFDYLYDKGVYPK